MAKILIADDALIMRKILRSMLEKAGHEIVGEATNGKEALDKYSELNPDLVTLDIQMADGDGISCLKEIIQLDRDAKVVMISALSYGPMEEEARSCGAAGYVSKPLQIENLLDEIRKVLTA